jgi:hypothetical protein
MTFVRVAQFQKQAKKKSKQPITQFRRRWTKYVKKKGKREGKVKHKKQGSSEWISMQQKGSVFLQIEDSTRETVFFLVCEGDDGSGDIVSQQDPCVRAWTVIGDARAQSFPSRSGSFQRLCAVLALLAEYRLE